MRKRTGNINYVSKDSNKAFYWHQINGFYDTIAIRQECELLENFGSDFYAWYHPTKWTLPLELYKSVSNPRKKQEIAKHITGEIIDLMLAGEPIELIANGLFLMVCECPISIDMKVANDICIVANLKNSFKGKTLICEYIYKHKKVTQRHFTKTNFKLTNLLKKNSYPKLKSLVR